MNGDNDLINPEEWTSKELLKHVYREVIEVKREVKDFKEAQSRLNTLTDNSKELFGRINSLENKLSHIEIELNTLRTKSTTEDNKFKEYLDIGFKIIGTVVGVSGIIWGVVTYLIK